MWYKNLGRTLVRFVTIHACDGQTDRRTDGHLCRRKDRPACMQRGKNQNLIMITRFLITLLNSNDHMLRGNGTFCIKTAWQNDSAYESANLFPALLSVCIHSKIFFDLYNPCVPENIPYKLLRINFIIIHCMCTRRIFQICHCAPENILDLSLCTLCMHGEQGQI